MARFLQYLFDGLSIGAIYSLVALGLVIVYRGTGHLNFAQGEMALFCTYVAYQTGEWGWPIGVSLVVAMIVGFLIGAATELVLVRPISRRSPFAVFIVTLGLFQGLNWLDGAIWGNQLLPNPGVQSKQKTFPALFPSKDTDYMTILGAHWRYRYLGVLIVVLVLTAVLFFVFNRTKIGLAMRAVASNSESSKLVGIPTGRVLMFSWGLAAAIGALGGVVLGGINGNVSLGMMFTVFVYASAAATLGGFDSPGGAVIGGLAIGVIENMSAGYAKNWIGQELKLGMALVVIVGVLLVRPSGLFGTAKVERV
jgi:branched-chain amino acid transport system permease protein